MQVRCKMQLQEITQSHWNRDGRRLKFAAQYDSSIPEDQRFQKATPSASIELYVDNPIALAAYELGAFYYFESTPVPVPVAA